MFNYFLNILCYVFVTLICCPIISFRIWSLNFGESPLMCLQCLLALEVRICLSYPKSDSGFAVILWNLSCNTFVILLPEFLLIDPFILFELFTLFPKFHLYLMRDLFSKYLNMLIPLCIWLLVTNNSSLTWNLLHTE
jgi:hypothetical protein